MTEKLRKPTIASQVHPDSAIPWLRDALDLAEGDTPFPWQEELFTRFAKGTIERSLDIPTRAPIALMRLAPEERQTGCKVVPNSWPWSCARSNEEAP